MRLLIYKSREISELSLCFVALLHCCKPLKTLKLLYPLERLNFLNPSIPL